MTENYNRGEQLTWVSLMMAFVTILLLLGLYWTTQSPTVNKCIREHSSMSRDAAWELCTR
jgi:hypothetical protein